MTTEITHATLAAGLRDLADWYEGHPDAPLPYEPTIDVSCDDSRAEAARLARLLGSSRKDGLQQHSTVFMLIKDFGPVALRMMFWRASVCDKRVVGTREIPEQVIPAHTEEEVEWDCHAILPETAPRDPSFEIAHQAPLISPTLLTEPSDR